MIARARTDFDIAPMTGAARVKGWEGRLATLIEQRRHMPFQWGVHDCTLFAADAVLAITGRDPAENHRGWYSDRTSALRHLARGHRTLEALATYHLGEPIPVMQARRGDIALGMWADEPWLALGVVVDHRIAVAAPDGLAFVRLSTARRAWHV